MRGRQRVPLAAPAERQVAGQVRLVRDGPVRVALGVGRLAAAVRLDAVADLAGRVGGAAGGPVALDREVAVRALRRRRSARRRSRPSSRRRSRSSRATLRPIRKPAEEHGRADEQPDGPDRRRRAARDRARRSRRSGRAARRGPGRRAASRRRRCPRLKNQSETENESSISRSSVRSEKQAGASRRARAGRRRRSASQTG